MSAVDLVSALGAIAHVRSLTDAGCSRDEVRRAVLRGRLLRPRRGVVALPTAPPAILRAAAAGGALAGPSAAEYHGLWTPPMRDLFVSVRADAHADRLDVAGLALLRDAHHLTPNESFVVVPRTAVAQCIRLLRADDAVAVLDSALNGRGAAPLLSTRDLTTLRDVLPRRLHSVLDAADARSENGAESLTRVRLARVGIAARPQVRIARGIRVDLLIGDALVVEIGSREFHAHPESYEADHMRSAVIVGLGFDYLEFTTAQVTDDWETVESVIVGRVASQRSGATRRAGRAERGVPAPIAS